MSNATKIVSVLAGAAVSLGAVSSAAANTSTDEVRSIVAEMMADAQTRSSLLQSGGSAGYDGGFFISDASGNNTLKVNGQIQFRYIANFADDNGVDDDDFESGFQTRRTKLTFKGNVVDPNLFYQIKLESDRDGGDITLQDAFAGYKFDNGTHLKWGQFRAAFARERSVSSSRQLGVERSLTGDYFGQTESQGIEWGYKSEDWKFTLAITDGLRSADTDFDEGKTSGATGFDPITGDLTGLSSPFGGESDFSITGRFEYKFTGAWDQFKDFTSMPGSDYAAMVGVAANFEITDGDSVANGDDLQVVSWTADLSLEGDGWNGFIAGYGQHIEADDILVNNITSDTDDIDDDTFGLIVQGGIFIPETDWELFARYDVLFADDDNTDGEDTFSTVTVGTNWYWSGHAAKFSLDFAIFLEDPSDFATVPGGFGSSGAGFLSSASDDEQFAIRAQFQLLF